MKSNELPSSPLATLSAAINAERAAQNAYAKFFFTVPAAQSDAIAELRLLHLESIRALESEYLNHASQLPEYTEASGPFSADPRQSVFDINHQLLRDFFESGESSLGEKCTQLADLFPSLRSFLDRRKLDLDRLLETLATSSAESQPDRSDLPSQPRLARCG